ncbi:hypothetical protein BT93_I0304 [Corymbia citriodora subsp. variegata]|nr:hypothetical protein BT93_I0304 [Corymbia citriodora subsp. variegata]
MLMTGCALAELSYCCAVLLDLICFSSTGCSHTQTLQNESVRHQLLLADRHSGPAFIV